VASNLSDIGGLFERGAPDWLEGAQYEAPTTVGGLGDVFERAAARLAGQRHIPIDRAAQAIAEQRMGEAAKYASWATGAGMGGGLLSRLAAPTVSMLLDPGEAYGAPKLGPAVAAAGKAMAPAARAEASAMAVQDARLAPNALRFWEHVPPPTP